MEGEDLWKAREFRAIRREQISDEWREYKLHEIKRRWRELHHIGEVSGSLRLQRGEMSSLELQNEIVGEGLNSNTRGGIEGHELGYQIKYSEVYLESKGIWTLETLGQKIMMSSPNTLVDEEMHFVMRR